MVRKPLGLVDTAKGLAVIALLVSLLASITVNFSARDNCREVQRQNMRIYNSQNTQIRKAERGELDAQYQRIYGEQWQQIKQQQLVAARAIRDRFAPRECHIPMLRWLY